MLLFAFVPRVFYAFIVSQLWLLFLLLGSIRIEISLICLKHEKKLKTFFHQPTMCVHVARQEEAEDSWFIVLLDIFCVSKTYILHFLVFFLNLLLVLQQQRKTWVVWSYKQNKARRANKFLLHKCMNNFSLSSSPFSRQTNIEIHVCELRELFEREENRVNIFFLDMHKNRGWKRKGM